LRLLLSQCGRLCLSLLCVGYVTLDALELSAQLSSTSQQLLNFVLEQPYQFGEVLDFCVLGGLVRVTVARVIGKQVSLHFTIMLRLFHHILEKFHHLSHGAVVL